MKGKLHKAIALAVLFLAITAAFLITLHPKKAQSTVMLYEMWFVPTNVCITQSYLEPGGYGYHGMPLYAPCQVRDGDKIGIAVGAQCCPGPVSVGYSYLTQSIDNGGHWDYVSGSTKALMTDPNWAWLIYGVNVEQNLLQALQDLVQCGSGG